MFVNASSWFCQLVSLLAMTMMLWPAHGASHRNSNSAPLVQSFAWKMDESAQATLEEVEAATDWQTFNGIKTWGFGAAPIWVRYTLRAALPSETVPWVVDVEPALLEHLTLYDPATGLKLDSGLATTPHGDALSSINFTFQIPALPHERHIYLRVRSERSRLIATDVLPLGKALQHNQSNEWLLSFLISISTAFALWALMQWMLNREPVMGAFAIKQWIAIAWAITQMGFSRVLLGSSIEHQSIQTLNLLIQNWAMASSFWYLSALARDYEPTPHWQTAGRIYLVVLLSLPMLHFVGFTIPMRILFNAMVPLGLLLIWLTLLTTRPSTPAPISRSFLLVFFLIYFVVISTPPFAYLGWIAFHPIFLKSQLIHIFLDGLIMVTLLQLRARKMTERHQQMTLELDRAQQGIVFEQRRRQEQSQFLHMLMHELKTPLSVVSLALGNRNNREENLEYAGRAVQDMKAIIERCVQSDQLGELQLTQHRQTLRVDQFIGEIVQTMPEPKLRLHLVVPDTLPLVHTDPQLLQIILTNLLDNASHYSDPLTPVTVTLSAAQKEHQPGLNLRVSNTPGLAGWPDAQQVFRKYYRANGAQRGSGTGLGLYLSRQLSHSLGGTLNYEPNNQHVEFVLWIPLNPA